MDFSTAQKAQLESVLCGDGLSIEEMGAFEVPVDEFAGDLRLPKLLTILKANRLGLFMARFPGSLIHHAKLKGAEAMLQKLRDLHPETLLPNLPEGRVFERFKNDIRDAFRFLAICAKQEALPKEDLPYTLMQKALALRNFIEREKPKLLNVDLDHYITDTLIPKLNQTLESLRERAIVQIHRDVDTILPLPENARSKSPNFEPLRKFFLAIQDTSEEEAVIASLQKSDRAQEITAFITTLLPTPINL